MKKIWIILAIMSASTFMAFAGGSQQQSGSGDNDTIEFWAWNDDEQLCRKVVEAYEKEFPGRKVNITITPVRDYPDKLVAAMAANTNIDVMCINGTEDFSELVYRNQLLNLDDYIAKNNFDISIFGADFEQTQYNGSCYSLPYRSSVWVIAYNKTMFQERGVAPPSDNMTWTEMFEIGKKMTFGNTVGFFFDIRNDDYLAQAYQNGFTFLSDDFTLVRQGMEYKLNAIKQGITLPHSELKTMSLGVRPAFEQRISAMYHTADWTINQMRNSKANGVIDFEFDFVAMPHLPGKPDHQTHGQLIHTGINAKTKKPDAAFNFTSYLAGVQGAKIFAGGGTLPGAKYHPDVKAAFVGDRSLPPKNIDVLFNQTVHNPAPISPGLKQIVLIFREESELVFIGEKTIDQAVESIKTRRAEVLNRYK
jgi:multiple sugar transport system substrate-binding protein